MVTVGQQLTTPEIGWRRYENKDSRLNYIGLWLTDISAGIYTNNNANYTTSNLAKINFKFYGTKLRMISNCYINKPSNIKISIDDSIIETYSEYTTVSMSYFILTYEKNDLPLGVHTVEISCPELEVGLNWNIDAIDIDDTGYLVHPILNQVSSLENMQIGDCIPCRYTSLTSGKAGYFTELGTCKADEIPITGTATPNGLFYLIKSDNDRIIADRVLQTNISWNELDSSNLITGNKKRMSIVPFLNSCNQDGYIVTSSFTPYENNTLNLSNVFKQGLMHSEINITFGWLCIEFPSNVLIDSYSFMCQTSCNTRAPRNWTFEGWDGTQWVILDTRINITWVDNITQTFSFKNNKNYIKYRLNTSANNGGNFFVFSSLNLYNSKQVTIRSINSEISSNEWDDIIINSTLDNKITSGDNLIWNWKGLSSWTASNGTYSSDSIIRGNILVSTTNAPNGIINSTISATIGFRPILDINFILDILCTNLNMSYSCNTKIINMNLTETITMLDNSNIILSKILLKDNNDNILSTYNIL